MNLDNFENFGELESISHIYEIWHFFLVFAAKMEQYEMYF